METNAVPKRVFPARAGMSPHAVRIVTDQAGFPRPRGDEPNAVHVNAEAGLFSPPARG